MNGEEEGEEGLGEGKRVELGQWREIVPGLAFPNLKSKYTFPRLVGGHSLVTPAGSHFARIASR